MADPGQSFQVIAAVSTAGHRLVLSALFPAAHPAPSFSSSPPGFHIDTASGSTTTTSRKICRHFTCTPCFPYSA